MKTGILTLPFNNNYGGYLQCYALMRTLRKIGHEPIIINRRQNIIDGNFDRLKAFINNTILGKKERIYNVHSMEAYYALKGHNMYDFVTQFLQPMTNPFYSSTGYEDVIKLNLDAVIVGSDQVWRPKYVPDIEEFFLKYIPNDIRKISYAASFGTDDLEYSKTELERCISLLDDFYSVSVREKSGNNLLRRYFRYESAQNVIDPTMLLDAKDYKLLKDNSRKFNGNLFVYILDRNSDKLDIIRQIASKGKYKIFDIMNIDKYEPFYSISEWLESFSNADYVITDSFHGTVFSILFNNPFTVIANHERGNSRILDLLSTFGLENRMASKGNINESIYEPIDWNIISQNLDLLRTKSINFLAQSLS